MNSIYHRVSIRRYQDIIKTFGGVNTKENVEQILEEDRRHRRFSQGPSGGCTAARHHLFPIAREAD